MCGIAGIFDIHGTRPIDEIVLARMNQLLLHRGPDEGGVHTEPGTGLAHRRLSIIDLSSGQQPMYSDDRSLVVVFNGEIYNFPSLMTELTAAGHRFRTHCDTEVILYAWKEWGERCVEHFRGMFAFTLWDRHRQTLFMARDRLGIKPLHYALRKDGLLFFASELKSLITDGAITPVLDPLAVEDYFAFGYVPDPRTIFEQIYKLAPGHTLTVRRGHSLPQPRRYWDVVFNHNGPQDQAAVQDELIERLREAIRIRLIAEVPLGAFLSGGVDSSAVVALMAGLGNEPVTTCSIGFGEPEFNETAYAELVAKRYNTRHRVEHVSVDNFDLIDRLAWLYDEPYADSSALPTYRVCELARKTVTVALSGDGGDENFAGYRRYRWHMHENAVRRWLPDVVRRPLFGALGSVYPKFDWAPKVFRAKSTLESIARDAVAGYFHSVSFLSDQLRFRLYSEAFKRRLGGYRAIEVFRGHMADAPEHPLSLIQYLDFKTYLPGDILTKVDRASMAHGLEVRVPILDHKFVEWVAGLSPDLKLRGREGKFVFKRAFEAYLPEEILYRPKMGFGVPIAAWFRGPLKTRLRDALLGESLKSCGLFNTHFVEKMINDHIAGNRDYSTPLWSMLMFESFHRQIMKAS